MTITVSKMPGHEGEKLAYHRVNITTLAGLKEAERLHEEGWKVAQSSPWSITFYKLGE